MGVSRRNFLQGSAACAVVGAAPLPVLADAAPVMWSRNVTPPIFDGSIGSYQGVILREGVVPRLVDWWQRNLTDEIINGRQNDLMSDEMVAMAKRLAVTCHPRVTEGVWIDGD
jgi:hypothetical protein